MYGYQPCETGALETEYEKIAVFAADGQTKHAAKQLDSGQWTSKLGSGEDITHSDTGALEGPSYGRVVLYLRRRRRTQRPAETGSGSS